MRTVIRYFFRGVRAVLTPVVLLGDRLTRPTAVERDPEAQAAVDEQTRDLSLYHFPACPFCIKVRRVMHRLALDIELRDAQPDGVHRETLRREGGRVKVPCLRINESDGSARWLFESDAIVDYLRRRFDTVGAPDGESSRPS